jgi:hypothetical protein
MVKDWKKFYEKSQYKEVLESIIWYIKRWYTSLWYWKNKVIWKLLQNKKMKV